MNWHLHVTVTPPKTWTHADVAEALRLDVERHGFRPLVITNVFHDDPRRNYKELIPTKHHEGDEASASRAIFSMGVALNNSGWRVRRLKIEGDPRSPSVAARALYFETHLKNTNVGTLAAPMSLSGVNYYHTVRRPTAFAVHDVLVNWKTLYPFYEYGDYHVEAAVLDTAPELDHDWINQ